MNAVIAYMMVALTLKADGCVWAAFFAGWNNRQLYPKMLTLTSSSSSSHCSTVDMDMLHVNACNKNWEVGLALESPRFKTHI